MGAEAYVAAIVTNFQVGMVVFSVNNPGQRVHKGHGLIVVAEFKRAADFLAGCVDCPVVVQVLQQFVSLFTV